MSHSEPRPADGLVFLSTDQYLLTFGWRGRGRLVLRQLHRGDVAEAWRLLWRRPNPPPDVG